MLHRHITYEEQSIETLAQQFTRFAERECRDADCKLYEDLSLRIAQDTSILRLALQVKKGQPAPNMLFAAVQFLLFQGVDHPLWRFYPSVCQEVADSDPFLAFQSFSTTHADTLAAIISNRTVQTNEVRRCAVFLPALCKIAHEIDNQPFHFIDVGASAGFQMPWRDYQYNYEGVGRYGNPNSPVQINCSVRGARKFPITEPFPALLSNVGIDINPVDITREEDALWLRSFIFPTHLQRFQAFDQATVALRRNPPHLICGDALELLPTLLANYPDQNPVCLLFSFSSYQMFPEGRPALIDYLRRLGGNRLLFEVSIGNFGEKVPRVIIARYKQAQFREETVALTHIHGNWIEWQVSSQSFR